MSDDGKRCSSDPYCNDGTGGISGLAGRDRKASEVDTVRFLTSKTASAVDFASSGTRFPYNSPRFFVDPSAARGVLVPKRPLGTGTAPFLSKFAILSFRLLAPGRRLFAASEPWLVDEALRCCSAAMRSLRLTGGTGGRVVALEEVV